MYADLHIHSTHSDGSLSPEEIVREAVAHRVGLIAVTDHELATGSLEAEPLARRAGLGFIRGAEVECRQDGRFHHLLAYGVNFKDPVFSRLIGASRRSLDDMSVELVRRMAPEYPHLSTEDFDAFERDPALGGWKGLEYLMRRGVTNTLREGMKLYGLYGVTYEDAGFPPLADAVHAIHGAGGRAVLAHPGATVPHPDLEAFAAGVGELLDRGLDGVECYYPLHTQEMTGRLLALCRARDLIITAGSDCHGAFGRTRVGQMDIPVEALRLKELYP
jgi:predicted metal-dependent phosphoesterase TrpH